MPTREEVLRTDTFKDDGLELGERIYHSLIKDKDLQDHRTAKLLALLIETLHKSGALNDEQIDEMLFVCVAG